MPRKIHIPPSPLRSRPDSLASRCKIIVIFTRICVFVNKLFKIRSDIPYGHTNRISSAISPTILLLYWIHLIFQILVCSRQQLKLLAYGSQLKSYVIVLCSWFVVVFKHSLNLQNLVSSTKYILTPLVYHPKKSRLFTLINSLRLLPHNLLSFGYLGTEINKSKSVAL